MLLPARLWILGGVGLVLFGAGFGTAWRWQAGKVEEANERTVMLETTYRARAQQAESDYRERERMYVENNARVMHDVKAQYAAVTGDLTGRMHDAQAAAARSRAAAQAANLARTAD